MNAHPRPEELELYALGTLEGEEQQALAAHLSGCADCRQELAESHGRLALLGLAAPPTAPPVQLKQRLLEQIRKEKQQAVVPTVSIWQRWLLPGLSFATVVLFFAAIYLLLENRGLNSRLQSLQAALQEQETQAAHARAVLEVLTAPDTLQVTLVSGDVRPLPQGRVFYHLRRGLLFHAANLPTLPTDRTYQLWLIPAEGNPISAGIFSADSKGHGVVLLPALPPGVAAKAFAVTVEPAGGVPQPTGPKVLIGVVS